MAGAREPNSQQEAHDPRLNDLWVYRLGVVEQRSTLNSEAIDEIKKALIELPQHYISRREQQAHEERNVTVRLQRPIILFAGGQFLVGLITVLKVLGVF